MQSATRENRCVIAHCMRETRIRVAKFGPIQRKCDIREQVLQRNAELIAGEGVLPLYG